MERVAVFADVQNLYYTVKEQHNSHFDYGAFLREATAGRQLVKALAYATDKGDERQRRFQQLLKGLGFDVRLQPFVQRADGSTKGDWDVGIAVDMLDLAPRVETVVLASGDGDYAPVVGKLVDELGIVVEVYGAQDLTAGLLARRATRFVPIQGQMLLPIPTSWLACYTSLPVMAKVSIWWQEQCQRQSARYSLERHRRPFIANVRISHTFHTYLFRHRSNSVRYLRQSRRLDL